MILGSDNNNLTNNIAINNTLTGIMLDYSNGTLLSGNNASYNRRAFGINLMNSSNSILTNNIATYNNLSGIRIGNDSDNNLVQNNIAQFNNGSGIRVDYATGNTVIDNNAGMNGANGQAGITLNHASWNTVSLNNVSNNQNNGINVLESDHNTVSANQVNYNHGDGIGLSGSWNNSISGNDASNNQRNGISLNNSNNNTVDANTANNNVMNGLFIDPSNWNTISGNTLDNNGYSGVNLTNSDNNTIMSNHIELNGLNGISVNNSYNNLIYNNYFNNNQNVNIDGISSNQWNILPVPAPTGGNIIGGPMLAGNYWANPSGTGFSQTAQWDRGDGIVDHAFVIDANNSDYYPLGGLPKPPTPSGNGELPVITFEHPQLPYDSLVIGNTIPSTMKSCGSYDNVTVTFENTGTIAWSSQNNVMCLAESNDGFTIVPSPNPIPSDVVVNPGQSYTFPFTINVPCPMKNGTYDLRFWLVYTLNSTEGKKLIPFGDVLTDSVTVSTPGTAVGATGIIKLPKTPTAQVTLPQNSMQNAGQLIGKLPSSSSPAFITPALASSQVMASGISLVPSPTTPGTTTDARENLLSSTDAIKQITANRTAVAIRQFPMIPALVLTLVQQEY